jgi:hypothetical protein
MDIHDTARMNLGLGSCDGCLYHMPKSKTLLQDSCFCPRMPGGGLWWAHFVYGSEQSCGKARKWFTRKEAK